MDNPIACTTGGYPGFDLERVLQGIAAAGFRSVELSATPSPRSRINPEQMGEKDFQRLRGMLDGYDLLPVSVSGHADLAHRPGVDAFKARVAFAATLGVGIVNTGTGHIESAEDEAQFFAFMDKEIIPYAADQGVQIALETHGGLTGTAEDCLRTLQRLNSRWVGINYDPANVLYYRGVRPEADIEAIARHVIHVHLKDQRGGQGVADFPPLGAGEIDFATIVRSLVGVGYAGPYSVELEVKNIAGPEAEDKLRLHARTWIHELWHSLAIQTGEEP